MYLIEPEDGSHTLLTELQRTPEESIIILVGCREAPTEWRNGLCICLFGGCCRPCQNTNPQECCGTNESCRSGECEHACCIANQSQDDRPGPATIRWCLVHEPTEELCPMCQRQQRAIDAILNAGGVVPPRPQNDYLQARAMRFMRPHQWNPTEFHVTKMNFGAEGLRHVVSLLVDYMGSTQRCHALARTCRNTHTHVGNQIVC